MPENVPENDSRLFRWLAPLALLTDNAISLTGVVLVTTGGISWFFLLPFLWESQRDNPYFGILWVLDLIVFLVGLALIPIGAYFRRAKIRREGQMLTPALESNALRRLLTFVGVTTVANIVIAGSLTTAAVNYMETKSFCGFEVDNQMELSGLFDRKIGGLGTLQDFVHVGGCAPIEFRIVWRVSH